MKRRFFYSAAILIFFGAMYLVTKGLDLMNRPSNSAVLGGIAIILALFILVPSALYWIWHHHVTPHGNSIARNVEKKEGKFDV